MPIQTVSKEKALEVPPSAPAAAVAPKVRFVKTIGGGDPVPVGKGRTITFNVPVNNQTGELCSYGWYETSDEDEIVVLRDLVANHPYYYVLEQ